MLKASESPLPETYRKVASAFWRLLLYEAVNAIWGLGGLNWILTRTRVARHPQATPDSVVNAIDRAICFYFKPVRCLQRSIALAHLLRGNGFDARVVAGYRLEPFIGHAWVEVAGDPVGEFQNIRESIKSCMVINASTRRGRSQKDLINVA